VAVGRGAAVQVVDDRGHRDSIVHAGGNRMSVVAVEVMAAEAARPLLARNQLAMRNVERLALEIEIPVASSARGRNHGDPHPLVLAMAGGAGLDAERGAGLGESRLEEAVHRVRILVAHMTGGALLVPDRLRSEGGVGGARAEPKLHL